MKPIHHEVQTQNGIPTLSDSEIKKLVALNPMREKPLSRGQVVASLKSLKLAYAKHTGRDKKEIQPAAISGPPCPICKGEFYLRTGVCLTCINCAHSSSCG